MCGYASVSLGKWILVFPWPNWISWAFRWFVFVAWVRVLLDDSIYCESHKEILWWHLLWLYCSLSQWPIFLYYLYLSIRLKLRLIVIKVLFGHDNCLRRLGTITTRLILLWTNKSRIKLIQLGPADWKTNISHDTDSDITGTSGDNKTT